jgi:NAD(P)-dependent dehydrogenase (short-subunit alcohol dehydrogenase family)
MGRELAVQLAAEGCHLALCDVRMDDLEETRRLCHSQAAQVTCTTHFCDVSSVESIGAFRAAVGKAHR